MSKAFAAELTEQEAKNLTSVDVLMISFNRPEYTELSLTRLLESCDDQVRVWLWHNGEDARTLEVVKSFAKHPRVHEFHHSRENQKLREPTNWLWLSSKGDLVAKVDDDCLVPPEWIKKLRQGHRDNPRWGVVACWHFMEEDFDARLSAPKMVYGTNGHQLLRNGWVGGSGYLIKRRCIEQGGLLRESESFTGYCQRLSDRGWLNGWLFPLICQEHMDDPRSPHTLLKKDEDLVRYMPLSAGRNGVKTLAAWQEQLKRSAWLVQSATAEAQRAVGWRRLARRAERRVKELLGIQRRW